MDSYTPLLLSFFVEAVICVEFSSYCSLCGANFFHSLEMCFCLFFDQMYLLFLLIS